MPLNNLIIKNDNSIQTAGYTVNYEYGNTEVFQNGDLYQVINPMYMVEIYPKPGSHVVGGETGTYRICADDITVNDISLPGQNELHFGNDFDSGLATFSSIFPNASTNYGMGAGDGNMSNVIYATSMNTLTFFHGLINIFGTSILPWGAAYVDDVWTVFPSVPNGGNFNYVTDIAIQDLITTVDELGDGVVSLGGPALYSGFHLGSDLDAWRSVVWFDTIGQEDGVGVAGNKVVAVVLLEDGYIVPEGSQSIKIDFGGSATFVASSAQGMPAFINNDIHLNVHTKSNSVVTTTPSSGISVSESEIEPGHKREKIDLNFTGKTKKNTTTSISKIKITANEGYYFNKAPYLETTNNESLKIKIDSVTRLNNKINSYTLNVTYNSSIITTAANSPVFDIKYGIQQVYTRPIQIDNLIVNTTGLNSNGETRTIIVKGAPGATFGIAINEQFENIYTDPLDSSTSMLIEKVNDVSILENNRRTSFHDYGYGKSLPVFKGKIGEKGFVKFKQKFPNTTVVRTMINGDKTDQTVITLDNNANIRKGDKAYAPQISSVQTPTVDVAPNVAGDNNVTFDRAITISDNENITFKRNRIYSIDLIPDLSSTFGSRVSTTSPMYTLRQYDNIILRLKASISGTSYTITHFNDSSTGLSAGAEHEVAYVGQGDKLNPNKRVLKLKYLVDLVDSGKNWGSVTVPKFHTLTQSKSSWTNSTAKENGGTVINISNFTHSAVGANTITLSFDLVISKWGREDVTMELDLDNVLTSTP